MRKKYTLPCSEAVRPPERACITVCPEQHILTGGCIESLHANTWELKYLSLPPVQKYCKKCGRKTEFICSGQFRINAQQRSLDIWLVYKCSNCNTTWNSAVYSRIPVQSFDSQLLERFHSNDKELVEQYAMDFDLLKRNGVTAGLPEFTIEGKCFTPGEAMVLEIKSKYPLPVKISSIVRKKLNLSQKEYLDWISSGKIISLPERDLRKCRLGEGVVLVCR